MPLKSKAKMFVGTKRQGPFASVCKDCSHSDWFRQDLPYTMLQTNFSWREFPQGRLLLQLLYLSEIYRDLSLLRPAHFLDKDQDLTSAFFPILSYSSFVQTAKCEAQSISWVGGCGAAEQKLSKQTILPLDVIPPQEAPALWGTRCRKELDALRDEDLSYGKQTYKSFPFSSI